jgi:hypothetical protein
VCSSSDLSYPEPKLSRKRTLCDQVIDLSCCWSHSLQSVISGPTLVSLLPTNRSLHDADLIMLSMATRDVCFSTQVLRYHEKHKILTLRYRAESDARMHALVNIKNVKVSVSSIPQIILKQEMESNRANHVVLMVTCYFLTMDWRESLGIRIR